MVLRRFFGMMLASLASAASAGQADLAALLPAEVLGWRPEGADGLYTSDSLYDLIDGGAEVYRSLNVREVLSRRYVREGAPDLLVDLFDMGSSQDAYGAFHHDMREGVDVGVGRESEEQGGNLAFWKDRFFVSLVPLRATEEARQAVLAAGKAIAAAIPNEGEKPELVSLLPPGGLVAGQIHYFHDGLLLGRHHVIGQGDLLKLGRDTEGVIARYRRPAPPGEGGTSALLLIRYPSAQRAAEASEGFARLHVIAADGEGIGEARSGGWAGSRLRGNLLVCVVDAPSRADVTALMAEVLARTPAQR